MEFTEYEMRLMLQALRIAAEDGSIYSAMGEEDGADIVDIAIAAIAAKIERVRKRRR